MELAGPEGHRADDQQGDESAEQDGKR